MYTVFKYDFGLKNVILLPSNYRHVSATQVVIFRLMRIKIQIQLLCVEITQSFNHRIFNSDYCVI